MVDATVYSLPVIPGSRDVKERDIFIAIVVMIIHHGDMKLAYNACTISCMDTLEVLWVMPKHPYPASKSIFCKFATKTKLAFYKTVSTKTHVLSINTKHMFHFEQIFGNMVFLGTGSIRWKKAWR